MAGEDKRFISLQKAGHDRLGKILFFFCDGQTSTKVALLSLHAKVDDTGCISN